MSIILTFPGQGSQAIGMGQEFYHNFTEAKRVFQEVDDVLNQKLSSLIFSGTSEDLTLTENAQPALMTVSMAIVRTLEHELGFFLKDKVAFMAGHSLGEYTAYCATGSFSLGDTAKLLKIRGQAMQEAVPLGMGAMTAILGLEINDVEQVVAESQDSKCICVIANDNSPGQVVISGHSDAVEKASKLALEKGAKRAIPLAVSAPFHSPLMDSAAKKMAVALEEKSMKDATAPVISNVTIQPIRQKDVAKKLLVDQITKRVRWRESIAGLSDRGVTHAIEVGAGKVLTGLSKRISPDLTSFSINTPADISAFSDLFK